MSSAAQTTLAAREMVAPAFTTKLGAVYNVDCLGLLAALKDNCIDTVFADPPFNLRKDYGHGAKHDDRSEDEYLSWSFQWINQAVRVLKPGGSLFIYNLPRWSFHIAVHLERLGLDFRHWIAVSMKGTFPRGKKLYPAHYALLYFTKGQPNAFNRDEIRVPVPQCRHCGKDIKDYGGHRKALNPLGLNLTDIWDDTAPARHSQFKARWGINELKPMIPSRCIAMSTQPNDIVLDPFGGGGSTFEAAERSGRRWIGSEIVDCGLIAERFSRNLPRVPSATPTGLEELLKDPNERLSIAVNQCLKLPKKDRLMVLRKSSKGLGSKSSSLKFAKS